MSFEEETEPSVRPAALTNTLILAWWDPEQRIQPYHTRILTKRNWDDKGVMFSRTIFMAICNGNNRKLIQELSPEVAQPETESDSKFSAGERISKHW